MHTQEIQKADLEIGAAMSDIANNTYKCVEGRGLSAHKGDLQIFNILTAMDGKRSVSTIAREDLYELDFLIEKVNQLIQEGILVPVRGAGGANIDKETIKFMQMELTHLAGPVGGMLLKKSAAKLGHDISSFPAGKISELLDMVSKFFKNQSKADDFKRSILDRVTE